MCRRRRLVRNRELVDQKATKKQDHMQKLLAEGWGYAPLFNMKFHAKEKKMDFCRRRRWLLKMVPTAGEIDGFSCKLPPILRVQLKSKVTKSMQCAIQYKAIVWYPTLFLLCVYHTSPSRVEIRRERKRHMEMFSYFNGRILRDNYFNVPRKKMKLCLTSWAHYTFYSLFVFRANVCNQYTGITILVSLQHSPVITW